jgi:hypothetical protein
LRWAAPCRPVGSDIRAAGVSRQWLYGHPDLRAQIEHLRARPRQGVPARERSREASLQQRLRGLLDDNRALREQVQALKHELELIYGAQRGLDRDAVRDCAPRTCETAR